ncbi:hypothetical protein AAFC00_001374 [Neodothiora populina]|uniref:LisH domain-containing protein n=1 Tax=Neodothiora populina TaxID=2781224 RepID=A0ABR3PNP1_9PEZI
MVNQEATLLVARFLKSHGYTETLEALIREANLAASAGSTKKGDFTLERVLEEKKIFDVSLRFEKLGDDAGKQWLAVAPAIAHPIPSPTTSNIIHTSFAVATGNIQEGDQGKHLLFATTADRRVNVMEVPSCALQDSLTSLQDSPVLSCAMLPSGHLLTGSMSGQITISDLAGNILCRRRDHNKYIVQVASHEMDDTILIATAGWDAKVNLYSMSGSEQEPRLTASIELLTNPEAILFIEHPDNKQPILIVTRRDSTYLYFHSAMSGDLLGKQNIAPHANSWTHQTPASLALCPTDDTLLAIATSATPSMKLLLVRLLLPSSEQAESTSGPVSSAPSSLLINPETSEQSGFASARAALALQDREAAAILIHCNTLAPQTAYSTPALAWRPDGSGVWVNSDDGVVRGIEASSGKVVATLKGHDIGSKIRCLCTALVQSNGKTEEWLVTGGFDQKIIVWKPET